MKAIVYHEYGSPDVLRMDDIPKPIPGDDKVLVKIYAVSINSWDWDWLTGKPFEYRFLSGLLKPKSTKLHGCDITGIVEEIGRNVQHFQVGDEVFGDFSEKGWGGLLLNMLVLMKATWLLNRKRSPSPHPESSLTCARSGCCA